MKFKVALVAALVAGFAASLAVAAPVKTSNESTGTDTTTTTTTTTTTSPVKQHFCRPRFSMILRGTLASVADDQLSFTMNVKRVNWHAKLSAGQTVTVQVGANTKIWRLGQKVALSGLTIGDHLIVQTRNCKLSSGATGGLLAALVIARPTKAPPTTTTTTTTTTTSPVKQHFCRPRFSMILRGTLASVADDQLSFTMNVKRVNWHAKLSAGQTVTVQVGANTKIWRLGQKVALSGLTIGDHLIVQTRNCKLSSGATGGLLAALVIARPTKAPPTTTTTTTTD